MGRGVQRRRGGDRDSRPAAAPQPRCQRRFRPIPIGIQRARPLRWAAPPVLLAGDATRAFLEEPPERCSTVLVPKQHLHVDTAPRTHLAAPLGTLRVVATIRVDHEIVSAGHGAERKCSGLRVGRNATGEMQVPAQRVAPPRKGWPSPRRADAGRRNRGQARGHARIRALVPRSASSEPAESNALRTARPKRRDSMRRSQRASRRPSH